MSTATHNGPVVRDQRVIKALEAMPARLRAGREQTGLSLRQLAGRLEISASALSQIETGKSQPTLRTLLAIVAELDLSLDELFDNRAAAETS
jgi:transcriptional regulator with XRE-family HTH domain